MTKRKRKIKKKIRCFLFLLFVVVSILLFFDVTFLKSGDSAVKIPFLNNKNKEKEVQQEKEYNNCLNSPFTNEEETTVLLEKKKEIDNLILNNRYKTSVYYEDLTTGFNYKYKETDIYYGCSLIKLVDALYLIEKATLEEIDLDQETVVYETKYKMGYSSGMAKHKIGEKVSLKDLITYAISLSDNSAHLMLIDYIGFNNLKRYGENLGGKVILTGGDNFGNQTAEDTNVYLKKAYQIITENKLYGSFLKDIMDNNERNDFNTDTIKIYHKYGSYENNYHDIGLSLEENPYAISIFTLHEYTNHQEVVQSIHEKIRELHTLFYEKRKNSCHMKIYGN